MQAYKPPDPINMNQCLSGHSAIMMFVLLEKITQLSRPTWRRQFPSAVRLAEEGVVRGFLQEDGLGILEEIIEINKGISQK